MNSFLWATFSSSTDSEVNGKQSNDAAKKRTLRTKPSLLSSRYRTPEQLGPQRARLVWCPSGHENPH